MAFLDYLGKKKKQAGEALSSLGATARSYAAAPAPKWASKIPDPVKTLKPAHDFLAGINTRPLSSRAKSTIGKLAGGIAETPYTFLTSVPKFYGTTVNEINSGRYRTRSGQKKILGQGIETALDTASMGLLGKAKTLAQGAMGDVAKRKFPDLTQRIVSGAKTGSKTGGVYGGGYGLSESLKQDKDARDTFKDTAIGAAAGTFLGGALGGGIPAVGGLTKAVRERMANPTSRRIRVNEKPAPDVISTKPETLRYGRTGYKMKGNIDTAKNPDPIRPTLGAIGDALPRPGMSIKDTSGGKPSLIPNHKDVIAAKNEKARQIVRNQVNLQRSGAQVAEPGFVPPASVKAPQKRSFTAKDIVEAFNRSTGQQEVGKLGSVRFEIGSLGKNQGARKSTQVDRFPGGELAETMKYIKNSFRASADPKNYRYDNIAWVADMPNGQKRVIYTRKNAQGAEEIVNWHLVDAQKNPKYMSTLESFGSPGRIRTGDTGLEDPRFVRLAYGAEPIVSSKPPKVNASAAENNQARIARELDEIPAPWAKAAPDSAKKASGQNGPYNEFQQAAYQAKQERIQSIREITDVPGTLRAMGFTKKEAGKLGVEESKIIAELGKLGYPKDDPILRDVRSETVKRILENKVPHLTLKEYYKKKHELDTHILQGIDPKTLKDISPLQAGTRDVYRNFETVFGGGKYDDPTFQKVKKELLDPFDASKGEFIAEQKMQLDALEKHIVEGLGIGKGSKLSSAVQMFGEGKLTLAQVKEKFPNDWQKIVKANDWFRNMYDNMLDETNRVREYYFPTHPLFPESSKVIPKRQNYYRHFQEMADGFKGLMNIFDTPANIDPSLAVSSEFTKPKTKWLSFAQQRKGEQTEFDAVGGFLDYIKANAYAKHIDPHIQRFRGVDAEVKSKLPTGEFFDDTRIGLAEELSKKIDPFQEMAGISDVSKLKNLLVEKGLTDRDALRMGKDIAKLKDAAGVKDYLGKNLTPEGMAEFKARALAEESGNKLNNFLKFLDNFANDLAGKTNPLDRPIQDNFFGRQTFRAINWANSRVKANVILGNIGSAVAQFFGIPNGIANAGARNSTKAVGSSLLGMLKDDVPSAKSAFLNERYFNGYDKFDPGVVANGKRLAVWVTSIGDKIGTTFTWNAQYEKALAEGVADPIKYADDWTRRMVAGRGVGEVPIMQKSKLIQIIAPFQLEVANQWRVFGDWARNDPSKLTVAKKLMEYSVAVWVMNQVAKELRGSDVAFDPINAMADAYESFQEADGVGEGAALAGGRIAGEVLSNLPGGSTAAAFYPEFGKKDVLGTGVDLPTREKFFGDKDPTRFGNGIMAGRAFLEPQYMVLPPYGGRQIKNTYEGGKTLLQGYAETAAGKVMTPVESTIPNVMKGVLFGKNSLNEVQDYREADSNPLGEKQDEIFRVLPKGERESYFESLMNTRAANKEKQAIKDGVLSGKVQGEAGEVGEGMYQLKDGNFFVPNLRADTKTFKTQELAQVAIEKEDFEDSGENFRDLGEYVLRKREDGTVYPQRKDIFTTQLLSARMTGAKKSDNFDEWVKHAEQKYELLGRLVSDPTVDELDRAEFQNQMMTLEDDIEKYSEYGGAFKKPKAGKKLEEKYRYPLVDKDMLAVERMLKYGPVPTGVTRTRRPLALIPLRARKVKRYKKRR